MRAETRQAAGFIPQCQIFCESQSEHSQHHDVMQYTYTFGHSNDNCVLWSSKTEQFKSPNHHLDPKHGFEQAEPTVKR
jgi:hypothetical protein